MASWEQTEQNVLAKITQLLPAGYRAVSTGGNNSTAPDGTIFHPNGDVFKKIEVKKIPSVGGIQVVMKTTPSGDYELMSDSGQPYAEKTLELANRYVDTPNRKIVLTGDAATVAFEAFTAKYAHSNVNLFIGVSGNRILACQPSPHLLAERFEPEIITRRKKSGSRALPPSFFQDIEQVLGNHPTKTVAGRLYLENPSEAAEVNLLLKDIPQAWVNPKGHFRQLSTTNNLTTLLSFRLNPNIHQSLFLTDNQFLTEIMS